MDNLLDSIDTLFEELDQDELASDLNEALLSWTTFTDKLKKKFEKLSKELVNDFGEE